MGAGRGILISVTVAVVVAAICLIWAETGLDRSGGVQKIDIGDSRGDRINYPHPRPTVTPVPTLLPKKVRLTVTGDDGKAGIATVPIAPWQSIESISQYGITWTFDRQYPAGRFVNGDWWVIGPVMVTGIDPPPGQGRNGSMINPRPGRDQAYDDRVDDFKPGLGVRLPFALRPGESLISSRSAPKTNPPSYAENNPIWLRSAAILTCLPSPPPADSFRPPYCGSDKPLYRAAALRKYLLPSIEPVRSMPSLAAMEKKFERPWLDHKIGWSGRRMHPYENMADYGRSISTDIGDGALMLLLDENIIGSKERLLIRYVQLGIDLYGIASNGGSWPSDGGHSSGRKFPILFAGWMLDVPQMLRPEPSVRFGEDDQTFYVGLEDLVRIHHDPSGNRRADWRYSLEMLGLPEWGIRHSSDPAKDNPTWSAGYRRLTAGSWCGWVLAARILNLKDVWNHDALFDYQDRYMETERIRGPQIDGGTHRGSSGFAEEFWNKYRRLY